MVIESMSPWLWLAMALVLLFVEFYLPSGVIATIATVVFIVSLVDAFMVLGMVGGFFFFLIAVCGGCLVVRLALFIIRKSSSKNTFFLSSNQDGFVGVRADASLVGMTGVALSDLRPSGFALIAQQRVQVISDGRYIEKGTEIFVEACRGGYLVVNERKG
jgi:membrane-bound serine protease (ClpP class)